MSEEWGTPISKEKIIDRRNRLIEYQKTQDMRFTVGYQIIDENILDINYMIYEIERLNNIINELEKGLKDNIDMCDGFIDTATSDLQELGARQNGKAYYQTLLLENKIALKIYQNELNKVQELKAKKY